MFTHQRAIPSSSSATFGRKWRKKVPKEALALRSSRSPNRCHLAGQVDLSPFLSQSQQLFFRVAGLLEELDEEGTLLDDSQKDIGKKVPFCDS